MSTPTGRGGVVLVGALAVDSIGTGLFLPLSLIFFARLTDVPLIEIGVLVSVASVLAAPIPIWAGALADRFGPFPIVVAAQLGQAIGFLGYNWVTGPVGILGTTLLVTVGLRFFWSSVFTAVVDYADSGAATMTRDSWLAWANMARNGGLALGGLITGLAIANGRTTAYHPIAYGVAACYLVAAVAIAVFVRAPRQAATVDAPTSGYRILLRDRRFLSLTGINAVFAMTSMMLALGLPSFVLLGLHGPAWLASAVLVGNTVMISVLAAPVVNRLSACRRTRVIMTAAGLWTGWSVLVALLVLGPGVWVVPVLVVATILFSVAEIMHAPVSMALVTAIAPAGSRGRYLATFQYSFTLAQVIAPTFFTTLFAVHHVLPWLGLAVLNGVGVLAMLRWERDLPASAQRADRAADMA